MLNSKKKEKYKYNIDKSYHLHHNIDRVWLVARNFLRISIINGRKHFPPIVTKGKDSFTTGNEFEGRIFGILPYIGKVIKVLNYSQLRKITWELNTSLNEKIIIKSIVYQVTKDNTSLLRIKSKYNSERINNYMNFGEFKYEYVDILKKIEKLLDESSLELFQYESAIINAKMEDLFYFITNGEKVNKLFPNINLLRINLLNIKVGEIFTVVSKNKEIFNIKVIQLDKKEGVKNWVLTLELIDGKPFVAKQIIKYNFWKINNYECQISIKHEFIEKISPEILENLSIRKKSFLKQLQNYFLNNDDKKKENK